MKKLEVRSIILAEKGDKDMNTGSFMITAKCKHNIVDAWHYYDIYIVW